MQPVSKVLFSAFVASLWFTSFTTYALPTSPRLLKDFDISRHLFRRIAVRDTITTPAGQTVTSDYLGFVATNPTDQPWTASFSAPFNPGMYCDLSSGKLENGACTGYTIYVGFAGKVNIEVPPQSSISVKTEAVVPNPSLGTIPNPRGLDLETRQVSSTSTSGLAEVTFTTAVFAGWSDYPFIVGSSPELGAWDNNYAIALQVTEETYPFYTATVSLPVNTRVEYKFIRKAPHGGIRSEVGENRVLEGYAPGTYNVASVWKA
ncbi:hypothetical protein FRC03_005923 [Tulasnella sp. 419]|nr:hypothetical protein FRC02_004666 [Tulasnella sp. 418]KAG8960974.1 hypothetical protein FRC03_005923 [Tulasnella sp. 419]